MTNRFTFFASHVCVEVNCDNPRTLDALQMVWQSAAAPVIPTTLYKKLTITGNEVSCDGERLAEISSESEQMPQSEIAINRLLLDWHKDYTTFHGAMISRDDQVLLLLGTSGSGKSSLAWQAIKNGWQFHTDELTVTDGKLLWGVRRSLLFDATHDYHDLPLHISNADREVYQWQDAKLGKLSQPMITVPGTALPVSLASATPVFISMDGTDTLTRVGSTDTLKLLHEAAFGTPRHDLGMLADEAYTLSWRDPAIALASLEAICDADTAA